MITTPDILELLKKKYSNCSDYRVAKILDVSTSTVSKWTCHRSYMSELTARKAAQLLDLPEEWVVACIHAEQHKGDDIYPVWQTICTQLDPHHRRRRRAA